ncbi:MAG: cyclopropane-fatty-acyl-phospholipid synthase family protein [Alphaproteobacteria bacterium]|nr:cyclopropane-fatty-acyl-phospholipid synthase family protein [Alphaproteobacteria bacterium]
MTSTTLEETAQGQLAAKPPRAWRIIFRLLRRLEAGALTVVLPGGREHHFVGPQPGPSAIVRVQNAALPRRLLWGGNIGIAEAYMEGDWDSPDLTAVIELAARNEQSFTYDWMNGHPISRALHRLIHLARRNSRRGSRRNIAAHYDLGNEFYGRWLDGSMTYSSAVFEAPNEPLERAQARKYDRLAHAIDLKPGMSVLEIGCGWGGFAEYAARRDCSVTGITVSKAQLDFAEARMAKAGLSDRVTLRLQDYRDVAERYDRIVSIEMIEAVGERFWPRYFRKLVGCLAPGGRVGLQAITIREDWFEEYRRSADFIQRYIFPGGMLPPLSTLKKLTKDVGLDWHAADSFADSYARTLNIWRDRFAAAWPYIQPMGFDERFRRMWNYYLSYCEAGFRARSTNVWQIVLSRP